MLISIYIYNIIELVIWPTLLLDIQVTERWPWWCHGNIHQSEMFRCSTRVSALYPHLCWGCCKLRAYSLQNTWKSEFRITFIGIWNTKIWWPQGLKSVTKDSQKPIYISAGVFQKTHLISWLHQFGRIPSPKGIRKGVVKHGWLGKPRTKSAIYG